ncbi:MAG: chemotaxis protein CheX [Acidobacteria bacterium]|nr:chemotaxis protein CheX [Acidobacteriota bacterium]
MQQFPVEAYQAEISQIVAEVFQTMLGLEVGPEGAEHEPTPDAITAAIFFAGSWKGAVLIEASRRQALTWTARLMSIREPSTITDDVRDSLGELVNIIGGNLKSVLPSGVGLSMPTVVEGTDYSVKVCGENLVNRLCFSSPAGCFSVTLVEVV